MEKSMFCPSRLVFQRGGGVEMGKGMMDEAKRVIEGSSHLVEHGVDGLVKLNDYLDPKVVLKPNPHREKLFGKCLRKVEQLNIAGNKLEAGKLMSVLEVFQNGDVVKLSEVIENAILSDPKYTDYIEQYESRRKIIDQEHRINNDLLLQIEGALTSPDLSLENRLELMRRLSVVNQELRSISANRVMVEVSELLTEKDTPLEGQLDVYKFVRLGKAAKLNMLYALFEKMVQ